MRNLFSNISLVLIFVLSHTADSLSPASNYPTNGRGLEISFCFHTANPGYVQKPQIEKGTTGFSLNSRVQNIQIKDSETDLINLIKEGQKYSYNFEIEKAIGIFDIVIQRFPDNPKGYHYKSVVYLWYYLGNNEEKNYDGFVKYSDLAIKKLENIIDNNSESDKSGIYEEALLLLGSNYGYRAIAFGKAGKHLNMIWASQKSNSYLNQVISQNPQQYDAYLGLGLFKFALSQVPSSFKWALNMIGYDADQAKGLKYLKIAAEKGENSKIEAQYYLSQIYSEFLSDYTKSSFLLKELIGKYPNNVLFQYSYAVICIKERRLDEAEKVLKTIFKNQDNSFIQIFAFSKFLLGDVYFRTGNYLGAIENYLSFINSKTPSDYKGIASYRAALCSGFLNQKDDFKKLLSDAQKGNQTIEDDIYAKRKSLYLIKLESLSEYSSQNNDIQQMSWGETELEITKFYNYFLNRKDKQASDSLSNLLKKTINVENRAVILNYLAEIALEQKDYSSAIDYAQQSIDFNIKEENWVKPYSKYYLAIANYSLRKINKALEYLDEAEDYDDYDYKTKLLSLVSSLRNKISG